MKQFDSSWLAASLLGVMALGGCSDTALPPRGQALLYVVTDAPLPAAPGFPEPEVAPLFDRLRLEVFPPGSDRSCAGCTRELAADTQTLASGVSFGVVAEPGARVRARLFRSAFLLTDEPRPESTLETVVELPAVDANGVRELHLELLVDSLGSPVGSLEDPAAALPGQGQPARVGSWWGAQRGECATEPGPDEACVPGGAFWMGDPRLDFTGAPEHDGSLERLVVLDPFIIDRTETSVRQFRDSGLERRRLPHLPVDDPHEAGTGIPGCVYTPQAGEDDALSVNCLSWSLAQEYCASLGKELPSEAQLEFLLSGLGRGSFVWGDAPPTCDDAVFERGLGDLCHGLGGGVQAAGKGRRDRLLLRDAELVDIAGNVSEWAKDDWDPETGACWGRGLSVNPLCVKSSQPEQASHSYRGGHFGDVASGLRSAVRGFITNEIYAVAPQIGVRCARRP
ncbi:MAG: formylglycine-generating enzyme family protein [Polyangiaceae bacterium]